MQGRRKTTGAVVEGYSLKVITEKTERDIRGDRTIMILVYTGLYERNVE